MLLEQMKQNDSRRAFTLIEMLTVMAIMMVMMAFAIINFLQWGRGAAMRGAVLNIKSSLVVTRQWAVTHRARTDFVYGNCASPSGGQSGYYMVSNSVDGVVGSWNYLPKQITFVITNTANTAVTNSFLMDGTIAGGADLLIGICSTTRTNLLQVFQFTGRAKQLNW
jgi:prepilin-type N-terminal cleavage/methylation domain-containing protein